MSVAIGFGLPAFLDTSAYLSADETRALGSFVYGDGTCSHPGCDTPYRVERAHIVRVGTSGRRKRGTDGPQVCACIFHHTRTDRSAGSMCYAVRRSDLACVLLEDAGAKETLLAELPDTRTA